MSSSGTSMAGVQVGEQMTSSSEHGAEVLSYAPQVVVGSLLYIVKFDRRDDAGVSK